MNLQEIANQIRRIGGEVSLLVAEGFGNISQGIANIYADFGWFKKGNNTGLRMPILETNRLRIIGLPSGAAVGEILEIDGRFVLRVNSIYIYPIVAVNTNERIIITNNSVNIVNQAGEIIVGMSGSEDAFGNEIALVIGQSDGGNLCSFSLDANPFFARLLNTFKDPVDGDTTSLLQSEEGQATLDLKKGPNNQIVAIVDAITANITVKNASHDTSVKPESVTTPRLGVGSAAPTVDGHATVADFLGVGTSTPSGSEAVKVSGDTNLSGALDVSGAVTNPLLTAHFVIALPGGTLSSEDTASARTSMDVYSKAETDAAIAAAIAGITVDNALVGTPEEHNHTLS